MAREVTFPRTRHVALSGPEHAGEAKATGSQAILVPIRVAEGTTAPAGVLLPQPPEAGAPGVPEKGALPAAVPVPALAAGTGPAVPQQRELPWVVSVDIAEPAAEVDRCRSLDGNALAVRCPSSLEGRDVAGLLAGRAAVVGDVCCSRAWTAGTGSGPKAPGTARAAGSR